MTSDQSSHRTKRFCQSEVRYVSACLFDATLTKALLEEKEVGNLMIANINSIHILDCCNFLHCKYIPANNLLTLLPVTFEPSSRTISLLNLFSFQMGINSSTFVMSKFIDLHPVLYKNFIFNAILLTLTRMEIFDIEFERFIATYAFVFSTGSAWLIESKCKVYYFDYLFFTLFTIYKGQFDFPHVLSLYRVDVTKLKQTCHLRQQFFVKNILPLTKVKSVLSVSESVKKFHQYFQHLMYTVKLYNLFYSVPYKMRKCNRKRTQMPTTAVGSAEIFTTESTVTKTVDGGGVCDVDISGVGNAVWNMIQVTTSIGSSEGSVAPSDNHGYVDFYSDSSRLLRSQTTSCHDNDVSLFHTSTASYNTNTLPVPVCNSTNSRSLVSNVTNCETHGTHSLGCFDNGSFVGVVNNSVQLVSSSSLEKVLAFDSVPFRKRKFDDPSSMLPLDLSVASSSSSSMCTTSSTTTTTSSNGSIFSTQQGPLRNSHNTGNYPFRSTRNESVCAISTETNETFIQQLGNDGKKKLQEEQNPSLLVGMLGDFIITSAADGSIGSSSSSVISLSESYIPITGTSSASNLDNYYVPSYGTYEFTNESLINNIHCHERVEISSSVSKQLPLPAAMNDNQNIEHEKEMVDANSMTNNCLQSESLFLSKSKFIVSSSSTSKPSGVLKRSLTTTTYTENFAGSKASISSAGEDGMSSKTLPSAVMPLSSVDVSSSSVSSQHSPLLKIIDSNLSVIKCSTIETMNFPSTTTIDARQNEPSSVVSSCVALGGKKLPTHRTVATAGAKAKRIDGLTAIPQGSVDDSNNDCHGHSSKLLPSVSSGSNNVVPHKNVVLAHSSIVSEIERTIIENEKKNLASSSSLLVISQNIINTDATSSFAFPSTNNTKHLIRVEGTGDGELSRGNCISGNMEENVYENDLTYVVEEEVVNSNCCSVEKGTVFFDNRGVNSDAARDVPTPVQDETNESRGTDVINNSNRIQYLSRHTLIPYPPPYLSGLNGGGDGVEAPCILSDRPRGNVNMSIGCDGNGDGGGDDGNPSSIHDCRMPLLKRLVDSEAVDNMSLSTASNNKHGNSPVDDSMNVDTMDCDTANDDNNSSCSSSLMGPLRSYVDGSVLSNNSSSDIDNDLRQMATDLCAKNDFSRDSIINFDCEISRKKTDFCSPKITVEENQVTLAVAPSDFNLVNSGSNGESDGSGSQQRSIVVGTNPCMLDLVGNRPDNVTDTFINVASPVVSNGADDDHYPPNTMVTSPTAEIRGRKRKRPVAEKIENNQISFTTDEQLPEETTTQCRSEKKKTSDKTNTTKKLKCSAKGLTVEGDAVLKPKNKTFTSSLVATPPAVQSTEDILRNIFGEDISYLDQTRFACVNIADKEGASKKNLWDRRNKRKSNLENYQNNDNVNCDSEVELFGDKGESKLGSLKKKKKLSTPTCDFSSLDKRDNANVGDNTTKEFYKKNEKDAKENVSTSGKVRNIKEYIDRNIDKGNRSIIKKLNFNGDDVIEANASTMDKSKVATVSTKERVLSESEKMVINRETQQRVQKSLTVSAEIPVHDALSETTGERRKKSRTPHVRKSSRGHCQVKHADDEETIVENHDDDRNNFRTQRNKCGSNYSDKATVPESDQKELSDLATCSVDLKELDVQTIAAHELFNIDNSEYLDGVDTDTEENNPWTTNDLKRNNSFFTKFITSEKSHGIKIIDYNQLSMLNFNNTTIERIGSSNGGCKNNSKEQLLQQRKRVILPLRQVIQNYPGLKELVEKIIDNFDDEDDEGFSLNENDVISYYNDQLAISEYFCNTREAQQYDSRVTELTQSLVDFRDIQKVIDTIVSETPASIESISLVPENIQKIAYIVDLNLSDPKLENLLLRCASLDFLKHQNSPISWKQFIYFSKLVCNNLNLKVYLLPEIFMHNLFGTLNHNVIKFSQVISFSPAKMANQMMRVIYTKLDSPKKYCTFPMRSKLNTEFVKNFALKNKIQHYTLYDGPTLKPNVKYFQVSKKVFSSIQKQVEDIFTLPDTPRTRRMTVKFSAFVPDMSVRKRSKTTGVSSAGSQQDNKTTIRQGCIQVKKKCEVQCELPYVIVRELVDVYEWAVGTRGIFPRFTFVRTITKYHVFFVDEEIYLINGIFFYIRKPTSCSGISKGELAKGRRIENIAPFFKGSDYVVCDGRFFSSYSAFLKANDYGTADSQQSIKLNTYHTVCVDKFRISKEKWIFSDETFVGEFAEEFFVFKKSNCRELYIATSCLEGARGLPMLRKETVVDIFVAGILGRDIKKSTLSLDHSKAFSKFTYLVVFNMVNRLIEEIENLRRIKMPLDKDNLNEIFTKTSNLFYLEPLTYNLTLPLEDENVYERASGGPNASIFKNLKQSLTRIEEPQQKFDNLFFFTIPDDELSNMKFKKYGKPNKIEKDFPFFSKSKVYLTEEQLRDTICKFVEILLFGFPDALEDDNNPEKLNILSRGYRRLIKNFSGDKSRANLFITIKKLEEIFQESIINVTRYKTFQHLCIWKIDKLFLAAVQVGKSRFFLNTLR